jgi:DNA-directed RNA polymerase specialized sigma24 family protein
VADIREVRQALVTASRRFGRVQHEAEDVAHDVLVAGLRRGLVLESEAFGRAIAASARKHAAYLARTAARRRTREHLVADDEEATAGEVPPAEAWAEGEDALGDALPAALRTTLLLLSLGHSKSELRAALGITDEALRKRLQSLRDRAPLARPRFARQLAPAPAVRRTQVEVLPRLMPRLDAGRGGGRLLAVTDADGHGIIFSEVLTNARPAATGCDSAPTSGPKSR